MKEKLAQKYYGAIVQIKYKESPDFHPNPSFEEGVFNGYDEQAVELGPHAVNPEGSQSLKDLMKFLTKKEHMSGIILPKPMLIPWSNVKSIDIILEKHEINPDSKN